jgi:ATP-dependent DNA helicase RecQ
METPLDLLKKYWSHNQFRPFQEEIICSVMDGNDTLALLPTGGGKSVCFQIPALMRPGLCLVVSPLIALMKDQVENLKARGIKALAVHSGMTSREVDIALDNAVYGNYKFLYLSPERLRTNMFRTRAKNMNISLLAIDEAHCISQWGYDFRPDYLLIAEVRQMLGNNIPVIALTATATPAVADDIIDKLSLQNPRFIKGGFERENLSYVVRQTEDKFGSLLKIVKGVQGCGIVYVRERKKAEEIAGFLVSQGISAASYHAGFSARERESRQDEWLAGKSQVIVATNAFGMGIDKPDVRFVCHFDIPESLEAYYQEAGRAGRDGNRSFAVLMWNNHDILRVRQIIRMTYPDPDFITSLYQKLCKHYQIAYGEGSGYVSRFNLKEFSQKYKMHAPSVFYAIKYLESEDILELTEELDIPSRITFIVNRDELYKVQLSSTSLDSFIKSLLRLYQGLFSGYVSIDEEYIARATRNSLPAVKSLLQRLSAMGIINYHSGTSSPLIIFNVDREKEGIFRISATKYAQRKEAFTERIEGVISFAKEADKCRSGILMEYFGQQHWRECGICDICIENKKQGNFQDYEQRLERKIIELLLESPRSLDDFELLSEDYTGAWKEILRDLIDRGGATLNGNIVSITNKAH